MTTRAPFTWDILVRLTHWLIVLGFILNLFILRPGSFAHQIVGYIAASAVIIRLLWAMAGAKYPARIRDMIPTPSGIAEHWQELKAREHWHDKHNSIGLLFIWTAWLFILAIAATGYLAAAADTEHAGSLLPYTDRIEDFAYAYNFGKIHAKLVAIMQALAAMHIAAVFITSRLTRHNYLRPMIHKIRRKY